MFSIVDVLLILVVAGFTILGVAMGFVRTLGSLLGTVLGLFITNLIIGPVYDGFGFLFGGGGVGKVVLFIILFLLISKLIGLAIWIAEKFLNALTWVPFAGVVGRVAGGVVGFLEGTLAVMFILYVAMQYLPAQTVTETLEASVISHILLAIVAAFQVLLTAPKS